MRSVGLLVDCKEGAKTRLHEPSRTAATCEPNKISELFSSLPVQRAKHPNKFPGNFTKALNGKIFVNKNVTERPAYVFEETRGSVFRCCA